ncbi:hypothetical protein [Humisphaera borealis]|uniref:Uncharacterized protein n=1 Tax=Humisphaera borealis TaxID=2807512 RepID=A0A7M2WWV2_9BACT|nr:hypothetical protein [Humisphaera borealis]QOV89975.1 hypothetical protein IPV69_00965 [Humisphaera borealis]
MLHAQQVEELLCLVARMDRQTIARRLSDVRATFPIDFTPQFIETTELDRLRHIFLALCLQTHHIPECDEDEIDVVMEHVA